MRPRLGLIPALAALILLAGCGTDDSPTASGTSTTSSSAPTGTVSMKTLTDPSASAACATLFGEIGEFGRYFSQGAYTWEGRISTVSDWDLRCSVTVAGQSPNDAPLTLSLTWNDATSTATITQDSNGKALSDELKAKLATLIPDAASRVTP